LRGQNVLLDPKLIIGVILTIAVISVIIFGGSKKIDDALEKVGVPITFSGSDKALQACEDFNSNFYIRESFNKGGDKSISQILMPYVPNKGSITTEERYQDARIFCGASLTLTRAAETGNLEEAVNDVNKIYERFKVDLKFKDINDVVSAETKEVWAPFIMYQVSKELGFVE